MESNIAMVYIISFSSLYFILTMGVMLFFRRILVEEFRNRVLINKGYGYVRINDNDKRVREHFKDLKKEKVTIDNCTYFIDPSKIKFKGKAAIFEFKKGISEPIDLYGKDLIGTNAEYLDGLLMKMKALARVTAAKEMQTLLLVAGAAAIAGLVAAVIAYTNYNTLQDIALNLIK